MPTVLKQTADPGGAGAGFQYHPRHRHASEPTTKSKRCGSQADFLDDLSTESLDQRHAGPERCLEFQLAVHRAFGDGGDFGLQPDCGGELDFSYSMDINTALTSENRVIISFKECET